MNCTKKKPAENADYLINKGWKLDEVDSRKQMSVDGTLLLLETVIWLYFINDHSGSMLYYSKVLDLNPLNNVPGGYFVHYSFSFDSLDEFNTLHSSAQAKGWTVIQDDKKEYRTIKKYDTGDYTVSLTMEITDNVTGYDATVRTKNPDQNFK